MINADHNITIFNLRTNKKTRREEFIPTGISGVSFYDVQQVSVSGNGNEREESLTVKIRIPVKSEVQNKRKYLPEKQYNVLTEEDAFKYWTIQKGCYVLDGSVISENEILTQDDLDSIRNAVHEDFIVVKEYADNTERGTDEVKHWRIGGI